MENNDENISCNILLIGKTGAGKSSFANYLFDVDIFEASFGSPVTNWENNFQSHSIIDSSEIKINIFDSVGIEDDNQKVWKEQLLRFLDEKQNLDDANKIIHTLFYVINTAGARIETNELSILKDIESKFNLSVAVILTNCDRASKNEIEKLENIVKDNGIKSVQVSSVCQKSRVGEAKKFGREKALEVILSASYDKVGRDIVASIVETLQELLECKKNEITEKVKKSKISIFKINQVESEIDKILESIDFELFELEDLLPKKYKSYIDFLEKYEVHFQGKDYLNQLFRLMESKIDFDILLEKTKIGMKLKDIQERLDNDKKWSKISATLDIAKMLIFIKSTIIEAINDVMNSIYNELKELKITSLKVHK